MALIKCPECGREVSDKATSCPNCGYEINKSNGEQSTKSNKKWIVILICVFAVIACGVGAWWFLGSDETSKAKEAVTETSIYEDDEEEEDEEPMGVISVESLITTKTIEWCGSNQQIPVLASENSDIVATLKQLGFDIINQESKTFEEEGGESFIAEITTLKKENCSIETNGHDITITFGNVSDANKFINEAKEMGFKKSFEYEGRVDYNWALKDSDGSDMIMNDTGDIFMSQEGNKVSIYTAQP